MTQRVSSGGSSLIVDPPKLEGVERPQLLGPDGAPYRDADGERPPLLVGPDGSSPLDHGGRAKFLGQLADLKTGKAVPTTTTASEVKKVSGLSELAEQTKSWDATETAMRIASKEVSAVEVTQAAIERARASKHLGAIAHEMYAEGVKQAEEPGAGCFAGVPTMIKDMEEVAGAPTTFGSEAIAPKIATKTAGSVAEFVSTGAVVIGKTTTAEFGLSGSYEPTTGRATRNPINLEHTAGGSSSGAAAMVAHGVIPVAHGGDGGGSVRVPASFCGLVGLKATRGRLEYMDSTKRLPVKLNTYGLLTRSVRDTAAFFGEVDDAPIKGMAPIGKVEGPGSERLRVGVFIDPPMGTAVDGEVREATMKVAHELVKLGHRVDFIPAPYDTRFVDDFLMYWSAIALGVEEAIVKRNPDNDVEKLQNWTRGLASQARSNKLRIPGAIWRLRRFKKTYAKTFEKCDVMLSPVAAVSAPKIGELQGDLSFEELLERNTAMFPYTCVQNVSGAPAISVPAGEAKNGLPIGVQLASAWGQEKRLLELAYALES